MIPKDTIVAQAAPSGSSVDSGSTVGITVSTGPALVAVPDTSGKSPTDASTLVQTMGLVPRIQYIVDATNASGNVVAQDPAAQSTVPRRTTVTLSVAVAPAGDTTPCPGDDGKVVRTEPEANAALRPGEAVTIYYHPEGT
jgi:serine/threonine-protein kinase